MKQDDYFLNIPAEFISAEYLKDNNLTRKFYVTHLMIDYRKSIDYESVISIRMLLDYVGSPEARSWVRIYKEFIHCLTYMVESGMIEILGDTDLSSVKHKDTIVVKINRLKFYGYERFAAITIPHFKAIPNLQTSKKIENVLTVLIFVLSRMWRKGSKGTYNPRPEAYYFGHDLICKVCGMNKSTVEECLDALTGGDHPILVKYTRFAKKSARNIYVINKEGYEKEIENALEKISNYNPMGEFEVPDFW